MARKAKPPNTRTVEALRHRREEATRKNIPTAEYQSVLEKAAQDPVRVAYERRNRDLDPPLYIQEKVHPKALIDDLLTERHLLYVACTRARDHLLNSSKIYGERPTRPA